MEVKKSDIQKWVEALRSGEYKQGRGRFQSNEGYCCLGVACKVFVQNPSLYENGSLMGGVGFGNHNGVPEWLDQINSDFGNKTKIQLWELNDGTDQTRALDLESLNFDEIADCLELVYIHKILKD